MTALPKVENPKLTGVNPHFRNRYAPLDEVLRVLQPVLEAGFTIKQGVGDYGLFHTTVQDPDGKYITSVAFPFPQTEKAQELGSALTYCRRYGLLLAFNLVGEEDDDGEAAHGRRPAKASTGKRTVKRRKKVAK